jgi:probable rRNA maturation factor
MNMPSRLEVTIGDAQGRPARIAGLASWLRRVAPPRVRGRVSIALVSDDAVRSLNRRYRGSDQATDVLSFPSGDGASFLGDIVIARGVARRQARDAGHSVLTELRLLALHGFLHLLGYDHERDDGRMRRVEGRLRRKGGLLPPGLIERSGHSRRHGGGRIASVPRRIHAR